MIIKIRGASDDLIEVEGGIQEEFNPTHDQADNGAILAVSDGTALRIVYDQDGIWRITRKASGTAQFSKVEGDIDADTMDVVTLDGDIKWVALANAAQFVSPSSDTHANGTAPKE